MSIDISRWCPGNPENSGHEPLHRLKPRDPSKPVPPEMTLGTPTGEWNLMRLQLGSEVEGPAGTIQFCKHCHLAYFEPDAKEES